jgi:rubrerythrin
VTTLIPTKSTGATASPNPVLYVDPDAAVTPDSVAAQLPVEGVNGLFLADLLSAMLTHERCGTHLYRSVAGRSNNPVLKRRYEEFGDETLHHVEVLENLILAGGGNPNYVSAAARAVEAMDSKLLETTFLMSGAADPMVEEMTMLDAVFLAESMDHANWHTLSETVPSLPEGELRDRFQAAVAEVEDQEDQHLEWAKTTKLRMAKLQLESSLATTVGIKAEELVARIQSWFS